MVMEKSSAITAASVKTVTVLSVSPIEDDHDTLQEIFRDEYRSGYGEETKWKLVTSLTLKRAVTIMGKNQIPIALCEWDLSPGTWRELLDHTAVMPHAPLVVVTS